MPEELLEALKKLAEEERRSLNSEIVVILEKFVEQAEKEKAERE
jgi:hypothetical protein